MNSGSLSTIMHKNLNQDCIENPKRDNIIKYAMKPKYKTLISIPREWKCKTTFLKVHNG